MCGNGELIETHPLCELSNTPIPDSRAHLSLKPEGRTATPFQIAAKRLQIYENVNTAYVRTHWLAAK